MINAHPFQLAIEILRPSGFSMAANMNQDVIFNTIMKVNNPLASVAVELL